MTVSSFNPEWSAPSEWAYAYRAKMLNVVPAVIATEKKKHPVAGWKEFQTGLVPQWLFDRWYGLNGEHVRNMSMGFITGPGSLDDGHGLLLIDIDVKNGALGPQTWQAWLDEHENGLEPETWRAKTGSGGRHLYFRYPASVKVFNTQETFNGIDVRAEGGFVMAPPSPHYVQGSFYEWDAIGPLEENDTLADAPDWLIGICTQIGQSDDEAKVRKRSHAERVAAVEEINAFGRRTNGRELYMRGVVWAAMLDLYCISPISPPRAESEKAMLAAYDTYVRNVKTRLPTANEEGLEREGRGLSEFQVKWDYAMGQWGSDKMRHAAEERQQRPFSTSPDEPPPSSSEPLQGAPEGVRFPFETVTDLRKLPPMRWLVDKWVPETAVGIIYGRWGTGKSFIGFDLLLHLAYGMPDWHGTKLPGKPVDVLMIAREGHQGFVGRIDAFRKHQKITDDPERLKFMRAAVSFMREDEFKGLCEAIKASGIRFRLIMVDTVARVLAGVDTNEQQAVTLFMERCSILGALTGAAVIGFHHQNKSGAMMGSVYFEANSDFVFEVSRPEDDGPLTEGTIRCAKMKDGEDGWKRSVAYRKVALGTLEADEGSLVVERIGDHQETMRDARKWPDKDTCNRILRAVDDAWKMGRPWTPSHVGRAFGTYAADNLMRGFDLSREVADEMLGEWQRNGVLAMEMVDAKTKKRGLKVLVWP